MNSSDCTKWISLSAAMERCQAWTVWPANPHEEFRRRLRSGGLRVRGDLIVECTFRPDVYSRAVGNEARELGRKGWLRQSISIPTWRKNEKLFLLMGNKCIISFMRWRSHHSWSSIVLKIDNFECLLIDVDRIWPERNRKIYKTGDPGKPSARHLYLMELEKRWKEGERYSTVSEWALTLLLWLKDEHPEAPNTTQKTIQNRIAARLRELDSLPQGTFPITPPDIK